MATISERYRQKFAKSRSMYEVGKRVFAGGVTHAAIFKYPFPVYYEHAQGPFKYDIDGNQIIDYVMGNGSLIMGHSPKEVVGAIAAQVRRGTHLGGASIHQIRHAEAIKRLMPSMEQVRFTSSGTESTYLALRLARAYTGKTKVVKLWEHFHGWHEYVSPESGGNNSLGGIPQAVLDSVIVAPADASAIDRILSKDNNVAALILEPSGAHFGQFPLQNPQFLHDLREITARHGVVFIMDEVITGFRVSPGGAQVRWDVVPDLTTMAKIVAGGQPGAALGGRAEIFKLMERREDPEWDTLHRVGQAGTFNSEPTTAVAGIATLEAIATKGINARADAMALRLKEGLNEAFIRNEVTGHAHGIASIVHVNLGADCSCNREMCTMPYDQITRTMTTDKIRHLRRAMLVNGVDMMGGRSFITSSAFDEDVIDRTVEAFSQSLKDLREEGAI